jgi:mTERF domain-containing protein, mitochondrial
MELSNGQILDVPNLLTTRLWRLKQRHEFLKFLGRAKYDPNEDLFVSPKTMVEGTDKDFVLNVAKSSLLDYNIFLKTL